MFLLHVNWVNCFQTYLTYLLSVPWTPKFYLFNVSQSSWKLGVCSLVFFLPMFLIILFYTFEIHSAWSCLLIMLPNVFYLIDWFLYCQHYIWFIFRVSVFLLSFSSCLWISPPSYWPYHVLCNFLAYVLMWFSCFVHLLIWVLTIFIQPFFKGGGSWKHSLAFQLSHYLWCPLLRSCDLAGVS